MLWLAERLAQVRGVEAVCLGGSRAQGTERPDSDWDFALYYRGVLNADDIRDLGYEGTVVSPGDWAYPMNGGAWLTIEDVKVDLLYRQLSDVEHWTHEAEQGRWELFRVPSYLAGMASYVLVGELSVGRLLFGDLPRPAFPEALRGVAPERWRVESEFALQHAEVLATRGALVECVGQLCLSIIAEAQARLASAGEWVLNEKGIVLRAGLQGAESALVDSMNSPEMVTLVREHLSLG